MNTNYLPNSNDREFLLNLLKIYKNQTDIIKSMILNDPIIIQLFNEGINDRIFRYVITERKKALSISRIFGSHPDADRYDEIEKNIFNRVRYIIKILPSVIKIQQSYRQNRDLPYSLFVFKLCHDSIGRNEILNVNCCSNINCSKWCRKHRIAFKVINKWKRITNL
jgi:hypothetical protein